MNDPRKLAQRVFDLDIEDRLCRELARELLSALDALEAAREERDKSATPRARDEMFARTLRGIENELDHVSTERDRLAAELEAANKALREISDLPWMAVGNRPNLGDAQGIARSALAGGGHEEPEQQDQDLGTTASQSSVVKGEKA